MVDESSDPIDRDLQRRLLLAMRTVYPARLDDTRPFGESDTRIVANCMYLDEHGLCDAKAMQNQRGYFVHSKITARGLDFLAADGGLSAILGVVTIRLHADTVRDLIGAKIDTAQIPPEEKSALKRNLERLSETALQAATTDLVRSGLDHLPNLLHWLQTLHVP